MRIGLVGTGSMGAGLGWALRDGGARVAATLAGRSARSSALAERAGIELVSDLDALVSASEIILVVTPPNAARDVARSLAASAIATGASPLIADLNAIAPETVRGVAATLSGAELDLVDGSISGPPPWQKSGARIYLSGGRAAEVAALPWTHVEALDLQGEIGAASALKMCTASVYKGLVGLFAQGMRAAEQHGVLDQVLADLDRSGFDLVGDVVLAATKADRYVPEMLEISTFQGSAGLPPQLFEAFASVWTEIANSELAAEDPEFVSLKLAADEVVARLKARR